MEKKIKLKKIKKLTAQTPQGGGYWIFRVCDGSGAESVRDGKVCGYHYS